MRFLIDGPTIPDNLLIARDEGRVVFFCGAGVSRARAGLADFFGLAYDVIGKLGVPTDNPACKILDEVCEIDKRTGVSGLISADRIFGLLERDFLVRDIEAAVAKALQPDKDVDLSAHQILLNLATTPEGKVRLVTTNFDRLFEDCCDTLKSWQPPRLPDPSRHSEMDGIIHLHGYATKDYTRAEGDGFILSSSAFGRAYLSDGWATQFFKEILDRYVFVFVGYTADDPPVQYLLEAFNKKAGRLDNVYAFQSGLANEAAAKWLHKGVEAIPYAENKTHRTLWETLSAWAERAKAPDYWYNSVINLAKKGPEQLQPHERGQVAHIISTVEGARKFSEGDDPPPAEWLCVFDPNRRYARPGHKFKSGEQGPFIDPFDLYGLDTDNVPKQIDPNDHFEKRDIPSTAWDAFAANRLDRQNLRDENYSAIRGHWATNVPRLPSRLSEICTWIVKVSDQPATVNDITLETFVMDYGLPIYDSNNERENVEDGITSYLERYKFKLEDIEKFEAENDHMLNIDKYYSKILLNANDKRELGQLRREKEKWDSSIDAAVKIGVFCHEQNKELNRKEIWDHVIQMKKNLPDTTIEKLWRAIPHQYRSKGGRPKK